MKMVEKEMWQIVAVADVRGTCVYKESSLMEADECARALIAINKKNMNTQRVLVDSRPVIITVVE